jgi:hypothetical protein
MTTGRRKHTTTKSMDRRRRQVSGPYTHTHTRQKLQAESEALAMKGEPPNKKLRVE